MDALLIGPINSIAQTTAYAMPARSVTVFSDQVLEVSNTTATTGWTRLTTTTTGVQCAATFLRCTTAAALVTLKA